MALAYSVLHVAVFGSSLLLDWDTVGVYSGWPQRWTPEYGPAPLCF